MMKKFFYILLFTSLLTSCISVAVDSNSATAVGPDFVTATLPPTKQSYVPATLTLTPEVIIPPAPCAFSALGLVATDLKRDYSRTLY
ncbi:MAG: hypothetical protein Q7T89_01605, partial [Anaerolineales bacterium]|nr:hypothetical protein [Anaerolineales bacterium]